VPCRVRGLLLYSPPASPPAINDPDVPAATQSTTAYVRDVSPGHAGFICRTPLVAGEICWLCLEQADGSPVTLRGIVGRCRPFMDGWCEGVIRFALEPAENVEDVDVEDDQLLRVAV